MKKFFATTRVLIGWDWFVGPADSHDGRRRTTRTLKLFTKFARGTALGNAAVLLHGYVSFVNASLAFIPGEYASLFPYGGDQALLMLARSWIQAQLCVQSLGAIHRGLLRITQADHGASTSGGVLSI